MLNEIDKAYQKRLVKEIEDYLLMNGFSVQSVDKAMIEVAAGQVLLLRKAKRDLMQFHQENDEMGIEIAYDVINELQESLDSMIQYFGIDLQKHKKLRKLFLR